MAGIKACLIVLVLCVLAVAFAQERVKKAVVYPYGAYPYAAPYPYAAYPYAAYAYGHDDGSYFPGKYDPYY